MFRVNQLQMESLAADAVQTCMRPPPVGISITVPKLYLKDGGEIALRQGAGDDLSPTESVERRFGRVRCTFEIEEGSNYDIVVKRGERVDVVSVATTFDDDVETAKSAATQSALWAHDPRAWWPRALPEAETRRAAVVQDGDVETPDTSEEDEDDAGDVSGLEL